MTLTAELSTVVPKPEPAARASRRILIIDDNEAIHRDFRKIFAAESQEEANLGEAEFALFGTQASGHSLPSFDVDTALQGKTGADMVKLALARQKPYALAFVDIRMPPGWDGVRTVEELWRIDPDLHIVICTAYSDFSWDEIREKLRYSDRLLIIKKPFDAIEVRQAACALTEKWVLHREKQTQLVELEVRVKTRTAELEGAYERLRQEVDTRLMVEKELRAAQKLEALGRLVAGIGHEINNPLSYATANIDYILNAVLRQGRALPADELQEVLSEVEEGVGRIRNIVKRLKTYSRFDEDGKLCGNDLHRVIRSAIKFTHHEIKHRAELFTDFGEHPLALSDEPQLVQVFVNLLLNAAQALPETGDGLRSITVRTYQDNAGFICADVEDSGHGISPENLEHVFEPFFTTRPVGQGTGLGLPTCHSIVTSFGGRMNIRSEVGKGTTVTVCLRAGPAGGGEGNERARPDANR